MKRTTLLAASLLCVTTWARAQEDAGAAPTAAPAPAEAAPKPETPPKPEMPSSAPSKAKAPEPKPAAEAAPASASLSPEQRLKAEWDYLKQAADDTTGGVPAAAADDIQAMIERHPDAPGMDEAHAFLASMYRKQGNNKSAMIALLRVLYEYPDSPAARDAKNQLLQVGEKVLNSRQKPALADLAKGAGSGDKAERLAAMLQKISGLGDALYEPALEEFHQFQMRFPEYPKSDVVELSLAQLHEKAEKYPPAILAYRKLLAKYPDSASCSAAQFALAGLYAENLRDYKKAVDTYQNLVQKYPQSPEVLLSLQRASQLYSERLKQYHLAVETDEKVVHDFPKTEGALKAFNDEAKLLRDRLSEPEEAVKAYRRLVEQFPAPAAVEALENAATIARKDMKDYKLEIELRSKIVSDFPTAKDAAEELYTVAQIYESDLHDIADAIRTYKQVASSYMNTKFGEKARDRAAKLQ